MKSAADEEGGRITNVSMSKVVLYISAVILLINIPDIISSIDWLLLDTIHTGLLWGLAALGLNLLVRHTRLASFGHALFFGTGAYTVAVLGSKFNQQSIIIMIITAVMMAAIVGMVVGFLSRNYTGLVFGLFTLAIGQLVFGFIKKSTYFNTTSGLAVRPGENGIPTLLGTVLDTELYSIVIYEITVVFLIIGIVVMWKINNSPFGYALSAIGENRVRARMVGIPVKKYIWITFTMSSVYGGLSGALFAIATQSVQPTILPFFRSGEMLFMIILGGINTLTGPVIGGVVITLLLDQTGVFTESPDLYVGVFLILAVFFFPKGILGSIKPYYEKVLIDPSQIKKWPIELWKRIENKIQ